MLFYFFLLLVSLALTVAQQCPGDTTGCWMCPGSHLMQCLTAASQSSVYCLDTYAEGDLNRFTCLCAAYQWQADCWAVGTNCLEWLPNAISAEKMCELAGNFTGSSTLDLPTAVFSSLIVEQSAVTLSIWMDNSGTDIPDISDNLPIQTPMITVSHTQLLTGVFPTGMAALPTATGPGYVYNGPSVGTADIAGDLGGLGTGSINTGSPIATGSPTETSPGGKKSSATPDSPYTIQLGGTGVPFSSASSPSTNLCLRITLGTILLTFLIV